MDRKAVEEFLDKVVNDSDYRRRLETDPVGTLAEVGISIDPADLPSGGVHLPPPNEILRLWLEELLCDPKIGLTDHYDKLFRL